MLRNYILSPETFFWILGHNLSEATQNKSMGKWRRGIKDKALRDDWFTRCNVSVRRFSSTSKSCKGILIYFNWFYSVEIPSEIQEMLNEMGVWAVGE